MNQDERERYEAAKAWYRRHGCTHAHCPLGCTKAQQAMHNGELYCMSCLCLFGLETVMEPCTPETCPGDAQEQPEFVWSDSLYRARKLAKEFSEGNEPSGEVEE